ncbi:MAG TPA: LLM class flavin-dependent oxidoreductase [Candidatus Nitrosotalea sp.]|jgi:alkanesulfonate monooxygenase SsuD/methylene tetrahydromethanopterin reductase-like flavin-dependent oxidoreductase (luciferase family)|nr:LLM class flavin-dependent oxidoreductase [Candidatus Nitrosotalea sp.]
MRFGWLTLSHSPSAEADYAAIAEQLEQACHAEAVGFDSVWLTEHNFTGEAVYCDPIPFASALAARTSRVRIGFAVIQLALRHPIRLAVQLALLDNLSRGRLDVGVGRGTLYNEYEFVGYGLRSDDSRERSAEALEVLTRAWTEEPFTYQGKFFQVSLPALRPRVYQRPHPPIWRSVVTPGSFTECGRQGVPILTSRIAVGAIGDRLRLYEQGLVAGGHPAPLRERLRRDVAVWRHVYVAPSQAQAEDELAETLRHTRRHMLEARAAHNPEDYRVDPAVVNPFNDPRVSDDEAVRFSLATGALCGTPRRVAEQLAELRDAGVHHVLAQMSFGYLGHEQILASMRRFGEDVMPAFRDG